MSIEDIDPRRQYTLREAAALVASVRGKCTEEALKLRARRGKLTLVRDEGRVFVWGQTLLDLLRADTLPQVERTPAEAKRAARQAADEFRRMKPRGRRE